MNDKLTKKLSGKVALVTGGSRGIGAAIVKRLSADGASVAFTYSASSTRADEVVRTIQAEGGKVLAIKAEASDTEAVRLAVSKTVGTFGGIDILVNNAGAFAAAPIEQFSMKDFEKLIAVNVRAVFVATQEAARHMREGGRIIHIGSCNTVSVPFAGGSVYALTKERLPVLPRALPATLGHAASPLTTFSPARWIRK
jgi:3-oxoacyl-[acyl-carrier protein] reductase